MKVDLLDIERLIAVNKLQEVTSPRLFSNKMMYDPNGILSTDIFGISKGDRRGIFAYIDLKRPFIHPHIYGNILRGMFGEIKYIVSGQKKYKNSQAYIGIHLLLAFLDISLMQFTIVALNDQLLYFINIKNH